MRERIFKAKLLNSTAHSNNNLSQRRAFSIPPQEKTQPREKPDLQTQLEWHERFGHNFGKMAVYPPGTEPPAPSIPRFIQAQLMIGEPGDQYEQEADQVAAQVVRQINTPQPQTVQREEMPGDEDELQMKPVSGTIQREEMLGDEDELQMKPMVQRVQEGGGMAASAELEGAILGARGSGQPLDESVREPMEREFGADFSGVRVHTDAKSDQLSQSIQAKAFTTGQDVFFRSGAYEPGSRGGQELLAHELTHVIQQSGRVVQPEPSRGNFQQNAYQGKTEKLGCNNSHPLRSTSIQRQIKFGSHYRLGTVANKAELVQGLCALYGEGNEQQIKDWVEQIDQANPLWTLNQVYEFFLNKKKKGEITPFIGVDLSVDAEGLDAPMLPLSEKRESENAVDQRQRRQAIKNFAFTTVTSLVGVVGTKKFETRNLTEEKVHAEEEFVNKVTHEVSLEENPKIVITINNSPCVGKCAQFLANWVLNHELTQVTIYFANPYGTEQEFKQAVVILKTAGINVEPFKVTDYTGEDTDEEIGGETVDRFNNMASKAAKFKAESLFNLV